MSSVPGSAVLTILFPNPYQTPSASVLRKPTQQKPHVQVVDLFGRAWDNEETRKQGKVSQYLLCCYHRIPEMGQFIRTQSYFLTVLEAGKSKMEGLHLVRVFFLQCASCGKTPGKSWDSGLKHLYKQHSSPDLDTSP